MSESQLPSKNVRFIRKNGRIVPIFSRQKTAAGKVYRQAKRTVTNAVRAGVNEAKFSAGQVRFDYVNKAPRVVKRGVGVVLGAGAAVATGFGLKKVYDSAPAKTKGEKYQRDVTALGAAFGVGVAVATVEDMAKNKKVRMIFKSGRVPKSKQAAIIGVAAAAPVAFWAGLGALDGWLGRRKLEAKKNKK